MDYYEAIHSKFEVNTKLSSHFDMVDVSFLNYHFSLIPQSDFEPQTALNYLNYNTKVLINDPIRYNNISDFSTVVFTYPEDIEFFLDKKYKNVRYFHSSYRLITKTQEENMSNLFFISIHPKDIEIIIFKENEFKFYNIFPYENQEDISYYVSFIQKKLDLNKDFFKIRYVGFPDNQLGLLQKFYPTLKHLSTHQEEQKYYALTD